MRSQYTANWQSSTDNIASSADSKAHLQWQSSPTTQVLSGSSDYTQLSGLQNILLQLKQDLFQGQHPVIIGNRNDDLLRRFQLLEQHIDGLLRRKISFAVRDTQGGTRSLDYTGLLNEKENQIVELERKIANLEEKLRGARDREEELERRLQGKGGSEDSVRLREEIRQLQGKFTAAASLWTSQLQAIQRKYPTERFQLDNGITNMLLNSNIRASTVNNVIQVQKLVDRTVEIPVQDVRTKSLIHRLTTQLKKLTQKYPQLLSDLDGRLLQYVQQQLIDIVQVDELDRVVQIVKYVPDVVRVENIYTYSNEKGKRLQYHLRVLVKSLLIELEKASRIPGVALEIPESLLAMVREETAGIVDVEEILRVFTVVPKIVEVEKIVEKVVERYVEVPQVVVVERVVEKIVEVPKIQQIEKIVHVPVQIIKLVDRDIEKIVEVQRIVERIVEVPQITERIVQKIIQVPRIVEVEKVIIQNVPVTEIVEVERIVNNTVIEIKEIRIEVEKLVPVEKIVERIVEVPTYIEKIIEKVIEVPRIVEVEKIVQKIVKVPEFRVVKQSDIAFNTVIKEVERLVEKVVVVENTVERIVEVPQIIEKIVTVTNEQTIIKQVEVIREKLVPVVEIKEIPKIEKEVVTLIHEVEKIIERKVQVPVFQERIVRVPEYITNVVIQHEQVPRIFQVQKIVQKYITQTQIMQIQVPVIKYIKQPKIIHIKQQKIIQVPRTVQRIKQVRVNVQKIIEKMVEVPKVVEVERIVEKVVVVPRIIEKIVEVPQIVERIVERIVEVEKIVEVVREVQVPVEVEKIVEVEVVKTVFVPQEKLVERIVEKMVPVERVVEKVVNVTNEVEKIVAISTEVPKTIEVQRIVPKIHQVEKIVEIEKPTTVIVQVPVQVERIVTKVVAAEHYVEKIVQVPQIIEKIVAVQSQNTVVQEVERIVEKIVERESSRTLPTTEVVVQENVREVQVQVEKLVPVEKIVQRIVEVPKIVEKIVEKIVYVPQIVEVERIVEKIVEVPKYVQVHINVPHLIKVNQIFENTIQKNVVVPVINEVIKEIKVDKEKIIAIVSEIPQLRQIEVFKDKIIQVQKLIEISQTNNVMTKQIEIVDRFERTDVPIFSTVEKFIEIPQVNEKIVERIVIMPQVVEVLKYVHELAESNSTLGLLGPEQAEMEGRLRELSGRMTNDSEKLLVELRRLRNSQPSLKNAIDLLQGYLLDLSRLVSSQRILTVPAERIVDKVVKSPVLVPTQDAASLRNELALSLLVEKLILELKRLKKEQPGLKLTLDDDIQMMFFGELGGQFGQFSSSPELQQQLRKFLESMNTRLSTLGPNWTNSHDLMLSTILQERFILGNLVKSANEQVQKARNLAERRQQSLRKLTLSNTAFREKYGQLEGLVGDVLSRSSTSGDLASRVRALLADITQLWNRDIELLRYEEEPMRVVGASASTEEVRNVLESQLREAWATAEHWKQKFLSGSQAPSDAKTVVVSDDRELASLRRQVSSLKLEVKRLQSEKQRFITESSSRSSGTAQLEAQLRDARAEVQRRVESTRTTYDVQLNDLRRQLTDSYKRISDFELKVAELQAKLALATTAAQIKPTSSQTYTTTSSNISSTPQSIPASTTFSFPQPATTPAAGSLGTRLSSVTGNTTGYTSVSFTSKTENQKADNKVTVKADSPIKQPFGSSSLTTNKSSEGSARVLWTSSNDQSSIGGAYTFKSKGNITPASSVKKI